MAAACSLCHFFHGNQMMSNPPMEKPTRRRRAISCRSQGGKKGEKQGIKNDNNSNKKKKRWWGFVEGLKESLRPKQKGDWKDLMLMSFSFAVYIYISQMIVSAYCTWISILKHSF